MSITNISEILFDQFDLFNQFDLFDQFYLFDQFDLFDQFYQFDQFSLFTIKIITINILTLLPENGDYENHDHGLFDGSGRLHRKIVITLIQYLLTVIQAKLISK